MKKLFLAPAFCMLILASCDVRNQDKAMDNNLSVDKIEKHNEGKNTLQPATATPTQIEVIDKAYNFGTVQDGAIVEYSYRFKNIGTTPLIINSATGSCGCTVPERPEQPILPGETGFIKVKFDSKGRVGNTHKTVTVTSNASPDFPVLELTGEVVAKK